MKLQITESPRDAFQGLHDFIPTQQKIDYINSLLKVGFNIIDIGSFVSEKAIPQMKDTDEVIKKLNLSDTQTELMVLIANMKGVEKAMNFDEISWLAFPYSVSKTFLKLNINADFEEGIKIIENTNNHCQKKNKKLKVYLTMAFGNPYKDIFNTEIVLNAVHQLNNLGIKYIALSDITGVSEIKTINEIYYQLLREFPSIEFGFHLHSRPNVCIEKIDAAFTSGCRNFDAVINAMGGCPMTGYELVSNLNTIDLYEYLKVKEIRTSINNIAFYNSVEMNNKMFGNKV
ncbi:MAG: hypothetical protein ACOYO1_14310 [Bacteroidales bacterium]